MSKVKVIKPYETLFSIIPEELHKNTVWCNGQCASLFIPNVGTISAFLKSKGNFYLDEDSINYTITIGKFANTLEISSDDIYALIDKVKEINRDRQSS